MRPFGLDAEVYYGSTDWKPPTMEEAQKLAGTQDEDQNVDPELTVEEEQRLINILGFDPAEWDEEEDEDEEEE